jgi:hypothetical protein
VNGALRAAWGLTAFVVAVGVVMWIVTDRPIFAVFIVLGVLTGVGAFLTGRTAPQSPAAKEDTTP